MRVFTLDVLDVLLDRRWLEFSVPVSLFKNFDGSVNNVEKLNKFDYLHFRVLSAARTTIPAVP